MHKTIITSDNPKMVNKSCLALWQAIFSSFLPIYCEQTTAPPVASAEKILIINTFNPSTILTPETALCPHWETIIVSKIPIVSANTCSIIKGIISFFKSLLLNNKSITSSHLLYTSYLFSFYAFKK